MSQLAPIFRDLAPAVEFGWGGRILVFVLLVVVPFLALLQPDEREIELPPRASLYVSAIVGILVLAALTMSGLEAQQAASAARSGGASGWVLPRTADGRPDLEGVWENNSATPLERPRQLANKPRLSDEELASFERRAHATVLAHVRHDGPLTVQRALYPEGRDICHAVVVHPPGGVAAGDTLDVAIEVRERAHAVLTMPGAAKFYRCDARPSRQAIPRSGAPSARASARPRARDKARPWGSDPPAGGLPDACP